MSSYILPIIIFLIVIYGVVKKCNVYDMASNAMEWSTETSTYFNSFENFYHSCTYRGGSYSSTGCKTGLHFMAYSNTYSVKGITFRPILYL